jgi:hypothetical protein
MGFMKDKYCISRGEPTLHDVLEAVGLPHDETRTTRGIVQGTGRFQGLSTDCDQTGVWPLEARCRNCGEPFGAHRIFDYACPQEAA